MTVLCFAIVSLSMKRRGGGIGLFTSTTAMKGTILGFLSGFTTASLLTPSPLPTTPDRVYTLPTRSPMYIKASTICHTSYANHSATNNTLLTLTPGTANPVLVATIDIPPTQSYY